MRAGAGEDVSAVFYLPGETCKLRKLDDGCSERRAEHDLRWIVVNIN